MIRHNRVTKPRANRLHNQSERALDDQILDYLLTVYLFSLLSFVKKSLLSADWNRASTLPYLDPHVAWNTHAQA